MQKWQKVQSTILNYIKSKELEKGDRLPSDRYFADKSRCSLQPVIRAMQELKRLGIIERNAGGPTIFLSYQVVTSDSSLSFSHNVVSTYSQNIKTKVIELSRRLPSCGELNKYERKAIKFLGMRSFDTFYSITRLRQINNEPRVIHRSFLNPRYFADDLLQCHDFESESLIDVFNKYGYKITSRNTILKARFPLDCERLILGIGKIPVMEASQELLGVHMQRHTIVPIEYLLATYTNWEYQIVNRIDDR